MNSYSQLMKRAYEIALDSPDPSTQNGALIAHEQDDGFWIASWGCNTFPRQLDEDKAPERLAVRATKYMYVEHAERSAIFRSINHLVPMHGAIMVCPWAACADCSRAIILAGIKKVVVDAKREDIYNDRWNGSIAAGREMFSEAGVEVIPLTGFYNIDIRIDGHLKTV